MPDIRPYLKEIAEKLEGGTSDKSLDGLPVLNLAPSSVKGESKEYATAAYLKRIADAIDIDSGDDESSEPVVPTPNASGKMLVSTQNELTGAYSWSMKNVRLTERLTASASFTGAQITDLIDGTADYISTDVTLGTVIGYDCPLVNYTLAESPLILGYQVPIKVSAEVYSGKDNLAHCVIILERVAPAVSGATASSGTSVGINYCLTPDRAYIG